MAVRSARLLRALWAYRGFIAGSVQREFQSRYQNSVLGAVWTVLQPLALIVVYTVVFATVMRARLPGIDNTFAYSIYLCAGVLTWELFSEITRRGQTVFIDNANLLKKLSFPRISLPVTVIAGSLVNFAIVFSLFTLFLLLTGNFPGLPFIAFVPVIAVLVLFAIGLGIALGILNVFFRDVGQFFTIALQFWFWLTPIVYPPGILPPRVQEWGWLNPMTPIITAMQQIFVLGRWPDWASLVPVFIVSLLLCAWGWGLFRRHSGELVDEL
ncbi:MAG TPA: ABC transporter permease [Ramlibacter sp.]|nr:ABC transporter permease [Ramlibacter sp.]